MIERKKNLIYSELEKEVSKMDLMSEEEMQAEFSGGAKRYFEGFGDRISSINKLTMGNDSSVFIVKLKEFENRSNLVKVYGGLESNLKDKNDLIPILKKYYKIMGRVREYLRKNNNPLEQKLLIKELEFTPEYSVAQNGILIEKNGQVGSWIRNWIPGNNFHIGFSEHQEKWEMFHGVGELTKYLTEIFGFEIKPDRSNYKISINMDKKVVEIVFTDLADSITEFVEDAEKMGY